MCVSIGAANASFSNTKLYVGEAMRNGKYVHVLAYQNKAKTGKNQPNAMIIPFPTNVAMGPQNVLDTSKFPKFLDEISSATRMTRLLSADGITKGARSFGIAQVFDVGSYTVVLADNVAQVPEALEKVPENKRPAVSADFLKAYGELYPNQPVALCCWNGAVEAEPLLWWYEPKNPETLFVPTMDAHDGSAPDLNADVDTDHIVSVGSTISISRSYYTGTVLYSSSLGEAANLLPKHVVGTKLVGHYKNGDCFVNVSELNNSDRTYEPIMKRGSSLNDAKLTIHMNGWH